MNKKAAGQDDLVRSLSPLCPISWVGACLRKIIISKDRPTPAAPDARSARAGEPNRWAALQPGEHEMASAVLNEAAALIKAGKKTEAQKLLEPLIKANLQNIPAWVLEVETWPTVAQKKKVLEVCLRYNPGAPQVQQALAVLESTVSPIPTSSDLQQPRSPQGASPRPSAIPRRKAKSISILDKMILGCALFAVLGLLVFGCLTTAGCNNIPGTGSWSRILFIGNSYTYVNDLPNMFAQLARAGGHKVETGMAAEGGWTLAKHAGSTETLGKLQSSKWDYVILQEQSQIPAVEPSRTKVMYPAARSLVKRIKEAGATPIFFMTWAHRDGWPERGLPNYESMQLQIDQGYLGISQELKVPVAPVGYAWMQARNQLPSLNLWQEGGSHPNKQGTYLAACVFYAVIFRDSPEGLTYTAGIPEETAQQLQKIAGNTVLNNSRQWNPP